MMIAHKSRLRFRRILLLTAIVVGIFSSDSYSQKPDKKETIRIINQITGEKVHVELNGAEVSIAIKDNAGNQIREDRVTLFKLDTESQFEPELKTFTVNCLKDEQGCVTRFLTIEKTKKFINRISIPVADENAYNRLAAAFRHLNLIVTQPRYKDEVNLN